MTRAYDAFGGASKPVAAVLMTSVYGVGVGEGEAVGVGVGVGEPLGAGVGEAYVGQFISNATVVEGMDVN